MRALDTECYYHQPVLRNDTNHVADVYHNLQHHKRATSWMGAMGEASTKVQVRYYEQGVEQILANGLYLTGRSAKGYGWVGQMTRSVADADALIVYCLAKKLNELGLSTVGTSRVNPSSLSSVTMPENTSVDFAPRSGILVRRPCASSMGS